MKKICSVLLVVVMLLMSVLSVSAAQNPTVSPMYTNTAKATLDFTIDEDGTATIDITCSGKSNCTGISAVTYLERKVNGAWTRVDIGTADDQWTCSTTTNKLLKSYSHKVTATGEYRAVTRLTVSGTYQNESILLTETYDHS